MIAINSTMATKYDFTASYKGTIISRGDVEFTNVSEHDAAQAAICASVASQFGCAASDIRVTFWNYTGK